MGGREMAFASKMRDVVYLNYTYYIIILKDAYGCWSLTVHGCVNIHIVVRGQAAAPVRRR